MTQVTDLSTLTEGEWAADLETRSGLAIHVRPVAVGDEAALAEFFDAVSPEDLRFRFLSSVQHVNAQQIDAMTHVDHRKTEDFIVTAPGSDVVLGNAMLAADDRMETAEVAISIRADAKGKGIGWTLLEHVTRYAKARGIGVLQSIESRANHQAIELEREMGFTARPLDDDPGLVVLEARLRD